MIRWSGLAAFGIIVGIIAVFNVIFLDGIIEGIVEKQASLAVGARVDIGDLKFSLFGLNVDIRDLEVANPDKPMRNAIEVGTLAFDLATLPLLRKKIIIQRMEVTDFAWDTPRRTSGALPPRLLKKLEKRKKPAQVAAKTEERIEDCVLPDLSALREPGKGIPEDLLAKVTLPSSVSLASYRERVSQTDTSWNERLSNLPTQEEIQAQLVALRELTENRPEDVSQLPSYLSKVKDLQQELESFRRSLAEAQQSFQNDIKTLRTSLAGVSELKANDFNTVLGQLGIRVPSAQDLVCVLLGRDLATKVNRAIAWYRKLRRFMPAGKPKAEVKPRLKGADVQFTLIHGQPKFLIELARLSARPEAELRSAQFAFSRLAGELRGLTSHPAIYGKPMVFRLEGDLVGQAAGTVSLSGELDRRQTPADDRLDLMIKGFKLKLSEGDETDQRSLVLKSAIFDVDGSLGIKGETLDGRILMGVREPQIAVGSEAGILADVFKNLGAFDVTLSIGGTLDQPTMALSSSATKTLSKAMQNVLQTQLKGTEQALKKAIGAKVDKELLAANEETDTLEKRVLGDLTGRLDLTRMVSTGTKEDKGPLERLKKGILDFGKRRERLSSAH